MFWVLAHPKLRSGMAYMPDSLLAYQGVLHVFSVESVTSLDVVWAKKVVFGGKGGQTTGRLSLLVVPGRCAVSSLSETFKCE